MPSRAGRGGPRRATASPPHVVEAASAEPAPAAPAGEDVEAYGLLKTLVVILVRDVDRRLGVDLDPDQRPVPGFIPGLGGKPLTLPAYIGAMLVAAVIRNLDDVTGMLRPVAAADRRPGQRGAVAVPRPRADVAKLWELAGLALPLTVILVVQLAVVALVAAFVVFRAMGRDYEAAVMSSGFVGFMLGTTANAMANMEAMVQRFGPAPRAFLVVPMVGAFFIDFTNAILITLFLDFYR